jgi:hypothetical protein
VSVGPVAVVRAQDQGGRRGGDRPSFVDQLKETLGLTDEQLTKVKALDEQFRADMKKIRDENGGDWSAMREKLKPLMDKERDEIRKLLTDEQKPKFEAWVKKDDERRAARANRGGREGGEDQKPIESHPDKTINLGQGARRSTRAPAPMP